MALFPESADSAKQQLGELSETLRRVPEIRRMARNPVMLTALAVVPWNERRLPEQRADLYESVVGWLARSREKRQGRTSAECCLQLLQQLALAMQSDAKAELRCWRRNAMGWKAHWRLSSRRRWIAGSS